MHLMGLITPALPQTQRSLTIETTTGSFRRFCSFFIMGYPLCGNGECDYLKDLQRLSEFEIRTLHLVCQATEQNV
jgi:hypothetical protein